MSTTEEKDLQRLLLKALARIPGCWAWRNNNGFRGHIRYGIPGQGDISGILTGGRRLEIEVKGRDPKKCAQNPDQIAFQARIESLGGLYVVARDFDETMRAIYAALRLGAPACAAPQIFRKDAP